MVAAISENNALGKNNSLLWHLPDDFKRFKQLTTGHYIIMGRRTFDSLPKQLPNRTHVIITRHKNYHAAGCIVVDSLEKGLESIPESEDAYIIGGGEIYSLAMPLADQLEITRVQHTFNADTFFPEIDVMEWQLLATEYHSEDEKHPYSFTYETYIRR